METFHGWSKNTSDPEIKVFLFPMGVLSLNGVKPRVIDWTFNRESFQGVRIEGSTKEYYSSKDTKMRSISSANLHYDPAKLEAIQSSYTVADLRKMLEGKTWEDLVDQNFNGSGQGVQFATRLGCFLTHPCIAVCALGHIVALHYVKLDKKLKPQFFFDHVITGSTDSGLAAMASDFMTRFADPKLTDKVIEYHE
jgi:hypothetical protein